MQIKDLLARVFHIGLIGDKRKNFYEDKHKKIDNIVKKMEKSSISPSKAQYFGIKIAKDGVLRYSNEILTQKGVDMKKIREIWPEIPFFNKEIDEQIEIMLITEVI